MSLIDLNALSNGLAGITPAFGAALVEAAAVCFESQGHTSGIALHVESDSVVPCCLVQVCWSQIDERTVRCWSESESTTEHGAVAVGILLIKEMVGFTTLERARRGTGFDYWVGDDDPIPFQRKARLEVSGIRRGENSRIRSRLHTKIKQTMQSDGLAPVYVVDVEFGRPKSEIAKR